MQSSLFYIKHVGNYGIYIVNTRITLPDNAKNKVLVAYYVIMYNEWNAFNMFSLSSANRKSLV